MGFETGSNIYSNASTTQCCTENVVSEIKGKNLKGEVCFYLGRCYEKLAHKSKDLEKKPEEERLLISKKMVTKQLLYDDLGILVDMFIQNQKIAPENTAKLPGLIKFFKLKIEKNCQNLDSKKTNTDKTDKISYLLSVSECLQIIERQTSTNQ